jgi:Flp pilus assembly protein CpaB
MLALTIRAHFESSTKGPWLAPGSQVNVFWSMRGSESQGSTVKMLLTGVFLLGTEPTSSIDEICLGVYRLAVKHEDVPRVLEAQKKGILSLSLRSQRLSGKPGMMDASDLVVPLPPQQPIPDKPARHDC